MYEFVCNTSLCSVCAHQGQVRPQAKTPDLHHCSKLEELLEAAQAEADKQAVEMQAVRQQLGGEGGDDSAVVVTDGNAHGNQEKVEASKRICLVDRASLSLCVW